MVAGYEFANQFCRNLGYDALQNKTILIGYALDEEGYIRESRLDLNLCVEVDEYWAQQEAFDDGQVDQPPPRKLNGLRFEPIKLLPPLGNLKGWAEHAGTDVYINMDKNNHEEYRKVLWLHAQGDFLKQEAWNSLRLPDYIRAHSSGRIEWVYPEGLGWNAERAASLAYDWAMKEWKKKREAQQNRPPPAIGPLVSEGKDVNEMPPVHVKRSTPTGQGTGPDGQYILKDLERDIGRSFGTLNDLKNEAMKIFGESAGWYATWHAGTYKENGRFVRQGTLEPLKSGAEKVKMQSDAETKQAIIDQAEQQAGHRLDVLRNAFGVP